MNEFETYDLGRLAELLAKEHPEITELYLFGSRRYRTRSPRSDIDVLVVCSGFVQPLVLRRFIQTHCRALDLFLVKDGKATSCQNESFLESKNNAALIQRLEAIKFWTRKEGRLAADIDWTVSIRADLSFTPSALPFSPKSDNLDVGEITIGVLVKNLRVRELWAILAALAAMLSGTFYGGYRLGSTFQRPANVDQPSKVSASIAKRAGSKVLPKPIH